MRISKLDGLRGVFCLMVICFHYNANYLPPSMADFFVFKESYIFVDFFFVLSGFVISYNYSNIPTLHSAFTFIKKRFIRLFPLLFYTTTLFLFFDVIFNEFFPQYIDTKDNISQLLIWYSDSILFLNAIFINTAQVGLNGPSWSISAEMISYCIFALVTFLAKDVLKKYVFALIVLFMYGLLFSIGQFTVMGDFGFARGLLSFTLGFFVSQFYTPGLKWNKYLEYILFVVLIVELYYLHTLHGSAKELFLLFVFPISFAGMIMVILHSDGLICRFLNSKYIQYLGKWSYSIYLNHMIVLLLFPSFVFKLLVKNPNPFLQVAVFITTLLIIIVYSKYTYLYIEEKGRKFLSTKLLN